MRVSRDWAGLLAVIGAALLLIALAMAGWTRATGTGVVGYLAAGVTAVGGLMCLTIATGMAAGWWKE